MFLLVGFNSLESVFTHLFSGVAARVEQRFAPGQLGELHTSFSQLGPRQSQQSHRYW